MAGVGKGLFTLKLFHSLPSLTSKCFYNAISSRGTAVVFHSKYLNLPNRNRSSAESVEVPPAKVGQVASDDEKRDFLSVYPDIVQDLTNIGKHTSLSSAQKWFAKVVQYNVIGGKMNRGMAVGLSLKEILPRDELTSEMMHKAHILGWCIELLQSHFLMADDIIDGSKSRRGKPCWYLKDNVGLGGINDSLLMNAAIYKLINLHFKEDPYYIDILDLFHDVSLKTILGQCLDLQSSPVGEKPKLSKFTMEQYNAIVTHKTAYYSFYLPVALAMYILQSHFLMADDIIDGSKSRRGKPCWYLKDNVGLGGINDSLLMNAAIYKLINLHFKEDPYYIDILDLFHDVSLKTILGQCLDLQSSPVGEKPKLSKFTMEQYNAIVTHKTAYYSFYLPVALAMYIAGIRNTDNARVAGITDHELHRQARTILLQMGSFFQVQDDYLDCFGNPLLTGKVGTDIAEGKCTWLAVVALQRATTSQRKVMDEHYGNGEKESIDKIRELYKELNLPATYRAYEDSTSAMIKKHIQQISRGLNHAVFFKFLDKIYKRNR